MTGLNFTDMLECVNGECVVNETSLLYSLIGEQAIMNTYCYAALNACGESLCSAKKYCKEGVCLVPMPFPTLKLVTTWEDLEYCEDHIDGCVSEVQYATDDKEVVCNNDDATYIDKGEEWDAPMPTNQETICWSMCNPTSGAGSINTIFALLEQ